MRVTINIKLLNEDFNQSIADDFYSGKESEDNIKYLWEDEFVVAGDVTNFKIINNSSYLLEGQFPDGKNFSYEIPSVTIIENTTIDNKKHSFVLSKKLIKLTNKIEDKENNTIVFEVILKDGIEHFNPMNGIYIIAEHFPKELKEYSSQE